MALSIVVLMVPLVFANSYGELPQAIYQGTESINSRSCSTREDTYRKHATWKTI